MTSTPITLSFVGLHPTTELESALVRQLQTLEGDFGDLADWHVSLESIERDDRALFRTRIVATLAGGEVLSDCGADGYWWTQLDSAIADAIERMAALLANRSQRALPDPVERPHRVPEAQGGRRLERIQADIGRRVRRLQRNFPGIRGFDVTLETVSETPARAQRATITLHLAGDSLVSARTIFPATDDGFEVAARDAFSSARRQAVRYAARRQSRPGIDFHEPLA